jgi:hypothetical protein
MGSAMILVCAWCKREFSRSRSEYKRNNRRKADKTKVFCTQSCSTRSSNTVSPHGTVANLDPGNRRDDLTPFRWFLARVRHRQKNTDLTLQYLKDLWEQQTGRCPLTGWGMRLPVSTVGWTEFSPRNASLDKIIPSLGYVQGNVRFVALIANYAKGVWTDEAVLDFCCSVATHCGPVGA